MGAVMALMDEAVWRGKIYSGGWVDGSGGDAPVTEPATGAELGRTGIATPADVARAAQLAVAAQPAWAATPHTERSALLRRAADLWLANAADIEWWGIRESGKIPPAMGFETHVATQEIYEAAALPAGLLHVLPGGVETGEAVVTDPLIRLISFTGSTAAGRRVGEMAARQLKRVHLELGGNSALIVLDDVDLDRAVSAGAWGSFLHQGQICMTTGRHLVHEAIYDDYVAQLADKAGHLPVGDPATEQVALGPIIDERQRDKVHSLVSDTVAAGARLAAGGSYDRLFYRPTVLADVSPQMPAYAGEVFGPVAPVIRFATAEDAAKLAADSEYGLSLGILTRDVMRGLDLARQIPTGIVHINEQTVDDEPNIPFGGLGASGTGARFGGTSNLDAFTDTRWVTIRGDIAPYPFQPDGYDRKDPGRDRRG